MSQINANRHDKVIIVYRQEKAATKNTTSLQSNGQISPTKECLSKIASDYTNYCTKNVHIGAKSIKYLFSLVFR